MLRLGRFYLEIYKLNIIKISLLKILYLLLQEEGKE